MLSRRRWSEDVHKSLVDMLSGPPGVAAFDFDNTCIRGDIGERMLAHVASADAVRQYEAGMEEADQQPAYEWLTRCMAGHTPSQLRQLTADVLGEAIEGGAIAFREEIRELIWAMQHLGWEVWVVTGSPTTVVATVAQHYGVPAERVIGMSLAERDGVLVDEIVPPATYRHGKVQALAARASAVPLFAAGDSMGDLELLRSAAKALVLDRGDTNLREHARRAGWWVQQAF